LSHIQHDPLWMQRIALAREMLREVRVALPKAVQVSVGEPGEAHVIGAVVAGESAARQRIAIGVAGLFSRIFGGGGEKALPPPPPAQAANGQEDQDSKKKKGFFGKLAGIFKDDKSSAQPSKPPDSAQTPPH